MPPLSKVIPLPTTASVFAPSRPQSYFIITKRGSWALPELTARMAFIPCSRSSSLPQTWIATPRASAISRARSARTVGVIDVARRLREVARQVDGVHQQRGLGRGRLDDLGAVVVALDDRDLVDGRARIAPGAVL